MALPQTQQRALETPIIPDRLYFKIGEVARLCGVETYVLRFWETQFPQLNPSKGGTGQRLYRRRDVELILEIRRLVHGEGYTLSGARLALEQSPRRLFAETLSVVEASSPELQAEPALPRDARAEMLEHVRDELCALARQLAAPLQTGSRQRAKLATIPRAATLFPMD